MAPCLAAPRPAVLLLCLGIAAAAGCDFKADPLIIQPEFDDVSSFESDLGGWAVRTVDLGTPAAPYEAVRSTDRASGGAQSVRLRLENRAGQAKVLLERRYVVEKDQTYLVEVTFGLASADWSGTAPWRVAIGAAPDSPLKTGVVDGPLDTFNGRLADQGFVFGPRAATLEARSDAEGELFVYVGVWGTSAESRSYYLDDLRVALTRRGISRPL